MSKLLIAQYVKTGDNDALEDRYQYFSRLVPQKPYPSLDAVQETLAEFGEAGRPRGHESDQRIRNSPTTVSSTDFSRNADQGRLTCDGKALSGKRPNSVC